MCYNNYGDNMKLKIFDKMIEIILKDLHFNKTSIEDEIVSSYFVNTKEAYSQTTYYYVRSKDGKQALYLCPGYKFLVGTEFLNIQELDKLSKKSYKSRKELIRNEPTEGLFFQLLGEFTEKRNYHFLNSRYNEGFNYLTSLYYGENKNYLNAYNELYRAVKRECDNLGINYEMNPEKIIAKRLEETYEESEFKTTDIRICKSKESLDEYFEKHILNQNDSRKLSDEVTSLAYLKSDFTMSYCGEFLTKSDNLINALVDRNYPNRNEILKNYMEFFISKDTAFSIVKHLNNLISKADKIQFDKDQERYNSNSKFMEDLEKITEHTEEETYRYHATTSLEDAKRILDEGFYLYSHNLDSTSFQEFNINQILAYSYGNGTEYFGDFIIVISEPKEEDIVEELTEEEQEKVLIVPRRKAIIGNKPTHKVDKKHIVGIIDKKHEKVILNPEYINNSKKQINM